MDVARDAGLLPATGLEVNTRWYIVLYLRRCNKNEVQQKQCALKRGPSRVVANVLENVGRFPTTAFFRSFLPPSLQHNYTNYGCNRRECAKVVNTLTEVPAPKLGNGRGWCVCVCGTTAAIFKFKSRPV